MSVLPEVQQEAERVKVLRKYEILDTPPDGSFDHVVQLAAQLFNVPIALVTLVDTDRIWFKSAVGVAVTQIDRAPGLCASAILSDKVYVVEAARTDPRTLANPLVAGELGLQFYAAAPLRVRSGHNLGTLCIIDTVPRQMTQQERETLNNLGQLVIDQLELRLEARQAHLRQQQMLSMVAHELKNPLTVISAYASLIEKKHDHPADVLAMCDHIRKASDRVNGLINEILDTAKHYTQQTTLHKKCVNLVAILNRVVALNMVLANTKKQAVEFSLTGEVTLHGDEARLQEIFSNLLNNAIKYSPAGAVIAINLKTEKGMAITEICDGGPGLAAEDFTQLFQPFTRLSAKPTAGEQSTGLGLFIVKTLAEAHGGTVTAENNQTGTGACFKVLLPAA